MPLNPKQEFARVLAAALGTSNPQPTSPETRPAYVNPNHKLVAMLFEDCGENSSATAKQLDGPMDAAWLAALATNKGFGQPDAIKAHKAARDNFRCGKCKDVPQPRDEFIREFSERRALLKQRAQVISTEAQKLAAGSWERALAHVPKFRAKLEAQEKAIFSATNEIGTSPLLRMIDGLPDFMRSYIGKLKAAQGNRRPGELIPKL